MDIYERLTRMLTPLGGSLVIDAFMDEAERSRRTQREDKRAWDEEPPQRAQVATAGAGGGESGEETLHEVPGEPAAGPQDGLSDTGRLRLEVQEFMSRENAHQAEDDEIAEFMKEHSGFDPSEMK